MELRSIIRNSWALLMTILAIILLVAQTCSPSGLLGGGEVVISRDTITVVETNTIKVQDENYRDSVKTWYHKNPTRVPEYVYIPREGPGMDLSDTSGLFNSLEGTEIYTYGARDSLVSYMIYVRSAVKPAGVWQEYDVATFTITDSSYVRDSTSTKVTSTITNKVRVNQLYAGPEIVVYPGFKAAFLSADFIHKKGWQLEVGAGFGQFNEGNLLVGKVGFKKLISFRKKK